MEILGIQSAMSTAYHPQTNGATECVNQEIEAYLAIYCSQFPETIHKETNFPSITEWFKLMQQYRDEALIAHKIAWNHISQHINSQYIPFKIGQEVWLDTRNLKMKINAKLKPHREGPFKITQVIGKVNYKLALLTQWKIHPVFHAILLCPYKETKQYGPNFIGPPPDM
jgi:hypothetical protein